MQHGSVGFRPPCGQKCNVPRCNCSVGFLPHCHAAFLGGRGGHKPGCQISYFSDSDLFLGFWPFGLVKGAFGTKRDPKRAKRKIGMELWNCGIICYIALGPKSPRDPPKKQNWKPKSSENFMARASSPKIHLFLISSITFWRKLTKKREAHTPKRDKT